MFKWKRWVNRSIGLLAGLLLAASGALVVGAPAGAQVHTAGSIGDSPNVSMRPQVTDPAHNITPPYPFYGSGPNGWSCAVPWPATPNNTVACTDQALADINYARAQEGVPPMRLPANWYSLSTTQKLLVAINYERVDRGLKALTGLAVSLDAASATAAQHTRDPRPTTPTLGAWGSIWAGGYPNVLAAMFGWMYDDGYGSGNLACPSPTSPGCWGHRNNILAQFTCNNVDPTCNLVGGAGSSVNAGSPSFTAVIAMAYRSLPLAAAWVGETEPNTTVFPPVGTCSALTTLPGSGYRVFASNGAVYAKGQLQNCGTMAHQHLNEPVVSGASTPNDAGYWMVGGDGGIFAYGDAGFYGSMGGHPLNQPVVGIAPTPTGGGYWEVASDGGIFAFGNAGFYGSMGGHPLNQPVVGITPTPDGRGYWEVASDGGIFAFGDAAFYGSMGGHPLNRPVVGIAATTSGGGYYEVASDGGIFSFGSTTFYGSLGGQPLLPGSAVVGIHLAPGGRGYYEITNLGSVSSFGTAPNYGSAIVGMTANASIVSIA